MSLQGITSGPFLTEEDQESMQSTVLAIAHAGNIRLESGGATYPLPPIVARKIVNMLSLIANGEDIEIAPAKTELTVSQVRKFLRTSERHVNDLLDAGEIAFRMNGSERMVLRDSLLEFEQQREGATAFLDDLLELSKEVGTYDD
ncbi:MAG TPA: hypothetical protein DEB39_16000 [Planctomycetaceae bacterium]|nr:hypothetical protein [Planctomycetaceae bacterium]